MEFNQRSCSSSGTTDNKSSKILLKFKIPKNSSSGVDEQSGGSSSSAENVNINTTKRVCHVCDKEFESGQALGGHMRIHNQPVNKQPRVFKNYSTSDSDNSMSDYTVSCSSCGKQFLSLKSLFAHMRSHPESDWSSFRPSSGNYSSALSEDDDNDEDDYNDDGDNKVVDCTQLVPKWPVKARRKRQGIKRRVSPVYNEDEDEDDEEEMKLRDCVNGLLLLNHVMDSSDTSDLSTAVAAQQINGGDDQHQEEGTDGGSLLVDNIEQEIKLDDMIRYLGNGFNEQAKKVDDYDSVPVMKKSVTEEGGSSDHVTKDCNIGFVGQEGNANANGVDHVVENHHVGVVSDGMNTELVLGLVGGHSQFDGINGKDNHGEKMVMGNSKINKDKKIRVKTGLKPPGVGSSVGVAGASTAADKYKCTTCDKTFSSHQALGGHRSSHNKFKVTIINGDSSAKESFSAFAPPGQMFDHHQQQQQFNTSHDQVNRVPMSDEECATKRNSIDEVVGSSKANEHISSTVHQCSVCNKIFASGQALGGHKRCHWTAPPAGAQTAEQAQPQLEAQMAVRSSGEEASTEAGVKRIRLMGFDLNVPASMVDQDGASW